MSKKKVFVLDTSVLVYNPRSLFAFDDNDIVLPIVVIEELDKLKKGVDDTSRNAREASRLIDELRGGKKLAKGVDLPGGGVLKIELNHISSEQIEKKGLNFDIKDNRILNVAYDLHTKEKDRKVILISKDINMRIKADALGVMAENLESDKIPDINKLYSGRDEYLVPRKDMDKIYTKAGLKPNHKKIKLLPNQFITLSNSNGSSHSVLAKYNKEKDALFALKVEKGKIWGIAPRNREQQFALDILMDPDIKLVTLIGKAGTGKTLLALAAGMDLTIKDRKYNRLVVSRPIFPMGRDIGYLPGEIEDKLRPWMQPINDNLDFLMSTSPGKTKNKRSIQSLFDDGLIEVEPLTYIRGRSLQNQYLIVDEAQNLTPHEIKTIITRVGNGTKIVITGDPYQIDNPYLDSASNGLTFLVEKFKEESISGHITFIKGERSELAELAATIL
ncbi:phosphate starvation-inducible protein PhoH [Candidatus Parcubacteria bacterium]|nr:MAG: phosphate starvation-inducible protein PhoH [Candidatus Parcubacteria bacterium]